MTLNELQTRVIEAARGCPDIQALQQALQLLMTAGVGNPTAGLSANGGNDGAMSREEFMRRLRGS